MKNNKFVILFLTLFLFSCNINNKTFNDKDFHLLNNEIERIFMDFKKYDNKNYFENDYYLKSEKIKLISDYIINCTNETYKDSVFEFSEMANKWTKLDLFNSVKEIDEFLKNDKEEINFRIKLYENLIIRYLFEQFNDTYFKFKWVMPLIVPVKEKIEFGETFEANFYLACIDKNNKFKVVINGDTLNYGNDEYIPKYIEKQKERGVHTIKVILFLINLILYIIMILIFHMK